MTNNQIKDEHLERLWHFKEEAKDSIDELKVRMGSDFNGDTIDQLVSDDMIEFSSGNEKINLTEKGAEHASKVIRAHRIAERMMHNVLGENVEMAACEFEHVIATELVDSICILLGHPKECPHGKPIPEGECCKAHVKTMQSSIIPLTELEVGQSAHVAYVHCKGDQQLHKFDGLQIKPGALVKLHQVYPTYVIECENANVALDNELASNICLWKKAGDHRSALEELTSQEVKGEKSNGNGSRNKFNIFGKMKSGK